MKYLIIIIFISSGTVFAAFLSSEEDLRPVKIWGDLRKIGKNNLKATIPLETLQSKTGLHGLGMTTGLDKEMLILNGQVYLGQFDNFHYKTSTPKTENAAFLVYSHIKSWTSVDVPTTISTFQDLETFLKTSAIKHGLDPQTGFLFKLHADISSLHWFVVGGMGNLKPSARESFFRQRKLGGLDDRSIEAVGVYTPPLQGIGTSPKTPLHIHFKTRDNKPLFIGHLDNKAKFKAGTKLYLPQK